MASYKEGATVKVDGRAYKVGLPVEGFTVTDEYGYEQIMTTGQLDAGKRMVMPGTVDLSQLDISTMSAEDKAVLMKQLKKEAGI